VDVHVNELAVGFRDSLASVGLSRRRDEPEHAALATNHDNQSLSTTPGLARGCGCEWNALRWIRGFTSRNLLKDAPSKEKQKTSWIAKQLPRMIASTWLEKGRIAKQPYRMLKNAWLERNTPFHLIPFGLSQGINSSWMCLWMERDGWTRGFTSRKPLKMRQVRKSRRHHGLPSNHAGWLRVLG
jgi:hypothetical protein